MEKINVAELLKDCPEGMELDCTMYENVYFGGLSEDKSNEYPITVDIIDGNNNKHTAYLTKEGCWSSHSHAKCVIFPKGKTTWEGFVPPRKFKDGDIIFTHSDNYNWVSIFKQFSEGNKCYTYIDLCIDDNDLFLDTCSLCNVEDIITQRLATEEEKQKLLDTIKAKGYKWNAETKTLIQLVFPKFRESDWVIDKQGLVHQIENVVENVTNHTFGYDIVGGGYFNDNSDVRLWTIEDAKDGDVLTISWHEGDDSWEKIIIFKKYHNNGVKGLINSPCVEGYGNTFKNGKLVLHEEVPYFSKTWTANLHPATREQRNLLFQKIKEAGYEYNTKTKTLEKVIELKFKVGDRIKHKTHISQGDVVTEIKNTHYILNDEFELPFTFQDEWELVPNKFDISTLVPFESRVLMRSSNAREWTGTIFSHYSNNKFYGCGMCCDQCIPYEGNEHLLGKTDDCDEFYRTWEKTGD